MGGSLLWIPTALSTLRPATSPCVSAIRLNLISYSCTEQSIESLLKTAGSELQRVAEEFTRIECEFGGALNLIVSRNAGFGAVFDTLDVRFHFCGVNGTSRTCRFISRRSFGITLVEMGCAAPVPFAHLSWSFCRVESLGQTCHWSARSDTDFKLRCIYLGIVNFSFDLFIAIPHFLFTRLPWQLPWYLSCRRL